MPVESNDILKAVVQYRNTSVGNIEQNVYCCQVTDLVNDDDTLITGDWITNYLDPIYGAIAGRMAGPIVDSTVRIVNLSKKEFVGNGDVLINAVTTDPMPGQISVEVLARSRALGHVGRKYFGSISEESLEDGVLTAAALADFETALPLYDSSFLGAGTLNTYQPGTVTLGPGGVVTGFRAFVSGLGQVIQTARTQRSRIPGFGLG